MISPKPSSPTSSRPPQVTQLSPTHHCRGDRLYRKTTLASKVLPSFVAFTQPQQHLISTHIMGVKRSHRDSLSSSEDPSSPFSREPSADIKFIHLDSSTALCEQPAVMKCLLPPHEPLAFASIEEFDVHYHKTHTNRCSECQRNFPDEHILNLHIAENHDPFNAAKRERGEQTVGT